MTLGNHQSPVWLEGRWEGQKHLTAIRIGGAVASLRQAGTKITYASICRSVQLLYGVSMSPNTIKRNQAAYEIYLGSRSSQHYSSSKEQALQKLVQLATENERNRLRSRVARLRRVRKDALIASLLQLEDVVDQQKTTETNLRDEILRLATSKIHDGEGRDAKG
jgi:hypothetical protein